MKLFNGKIMELDGWFSMANCLITRDVELFGNPPRIPKNRVCSSLGLGTSYKKQKQWAKWPMVWHPGFGDLMISDELWKWHTCCDANETRPPMDTKTRNHHSRQCALTVNPRLINHNKPLLYKKVGLPPKPPTQFLHGTCWIFGSISWIDIKSL